MFIGSAWAVRHKRNEERARVEKFERAAKARGELQISSFCLLNPQSLVDGLISKRYQVRALANVLVQLNKMRAIGDFAIKSRQKRPLAAGN